ncbi:Clp protease [Planctomonas sp. JC2975]|uniref:Clp protease N-terminal domain-containing protein n=1 Tax=Planctomonas sp. JC2975 TaxID=2729626 RepID=UPI00147346A5|nr:Clp protease N-terminal domain-containing protein [Planctomonas sp. JC2975]NNC13970.1 Clp protease [Planctomonas sp. JC2975]
MFEQFAAQARKAVDDARLEASRRGDRRIGTEHLLAALLNDETLADAVGADAAAARAAADDLDRAALASIGLPFTDRLPAGRAALGRRVPFTVGAKAVLQSAVTKAVSERSRRITTRHLFLAVLDRPAPDPAAALVRELGLDGPSVSARLDAAR